MQLSPVGVIADILWYEIPHHANVQLGEYVVMPNHVHGILILDGDGSDGGRRRDVACNVSTPKNERMAEISPKSNSISTIIRSYKSAVTKHAHRLGFDLVWQPRFHDHIIRDDASFQRITNYIINNPRNWREDTFFCKK